jgi:GT2 family glycosyltransferase
MSSQGIPRSADRIVLDGKFFRRGTDRFHLKGITYGPFAPNAQQEMYPEPARAKQDIELIRQLGANLMRLYSVPPRWLLDLANDHGLQVLVDVPWPKHLCFLDSADYRAQARTAVRRAVVACRAHPAMFAFSVANEIPADIVRWSGTRRVEAFLDELIGIAKSVDPELLCTFTNFPPTEFLNPSGVDFVCFNVYLHELKAFEDYLARLQILADTKPLVLAEFGLDSLREGEDRKSAVLSEQIESGFRSGLAGAIVFSFTDDWYRGGMQIDDWAFGLTTRDRLPKDSFRAVQRAFQAAPYFPLDPSPRVSVVVATYNGARTLRACLSSLSRLNYPGYEVILVDDGSTDQTPEIARDFPAVRVVRQEHLGLSAARNTGIRAAQGEIVALTDADCRPDRDWLYYLVGDLFRGGFGGIGGHNFLPPDDSAVAAAVMASPGGPAHVMLTDREAEHVPGCNMAFPKRALEEVGGFDPIFHAAGDDVDLCWRLQQRGYKLGFSPAGFVWHHRRATVGAYLKQQAGYGEAEALLVRKHPAYFNKVGRSVWRGRIYASSRTGVVLERSIIYRGAFGSGFFQRLYSPEPAHALMFTTSLEYHALVSGPLVVLSVAIPRLWPLALANLLLSVSLCTVAALQAEIPRSQRRFWSRGLVAILFFLQPIARGLARYRTRLRSRPASDALARRKRMARIRLTQETSEVLCYWSAGEVNRCALLSALLDRLGRERWQVLSDSGWADHDLEILASSSCRLRLTTVSEQLDQGRLKLRCRLETYWSLPAVVALWALVGAELLLASRLAPQIPWIWMILLTLPILSTLLEHEHAQQRGILAATVDEVAGHLQLRKLPHEDVPR